jgi:hypothetical protein
MKLGDEIVKDWDAGRVPPGTRTPRTWSPATRTGFSMCSSADRFRDSLNARTAEALLLRAGKQKLGRSASIEAPAPTIGHVGCCSEALNEGLDGRLGE